MHVFYPRQGGRWAVRQFLAGILCALALLAQAGRADAQQRLTTPTLTQAARNNWMRFDLVAGRIVVTGGHVGNINTTSSTNGQEGETFSLQTENGQSSLRYSRTVGGDMFSLQASGNNLLKISRSIRGQSTVEFTQKPGQPVKLAVDEKESRKEYEGATLWHLLLAYPEICRTNLIPSLDLLRPEWKLANLVAAVEKDLLRRASGNEDLRRQQWAQSVRDLGSDQYAQREAADRRLRAAGTAALSYLEQIDPKGLDAEQQFRVRRIVEVISVKNGGRSAEQISAWLSGDPSIWLALLDRSDALTRETAARQIAELIKTTIEFDANAPAEVRTQQIEKLRHSLASEPSRGRITDTAPQRVGAP